MVLMMHQGHGIIEFMMSSSDLVQGSHNMTVRCFLVKKGQLDGILASHVDNFACCGTRQWERDT